MTAAAVNIPYEEFKEYILQGKTVKELETIYGCSRSCIATYKKKYELVGLTPNSRRIDRDSGEKHCSQCNTTKPLTDFYSNGYTPKGSRKYKAKCITCENVDRSHSFKDKIVDYLGARGLEYMCQDCGYSTIPDILEFHHLDPAIKEFDLGRVSKTSSIDTFIENIVPELDKCILLCPNCHKTRHYMMGQN